MGKHLGMGNDFFFYPFFLQKSKITFYFYRDIIIFDVILLQIYFAFFLDID